MNFIKVILAILGIIFGVMVFFWLWRMICDALQQWMTSC